MAINASDIAAAQAVQDSAAHDPAPQVRLIAGPGTGKSQTLQERVLWVLEAGVKVEEIVAVSFTRASAHDLELRIHKPKAGRPNADRVRVSTLHSLALRTLRRAGMLGQYPADPIVLDDWELENIFDAEFQYQSGITSKGRRGEIRRFHEAIWSTGSSASSNYRAPTPPISAGEQGAFDAYHTVRTQLYSCILPGEIVKKCVDLVDAGLLDPVALLEIKHVIVDEYQDLNPYDLRFIDQLSSLGAVLFVGGDDDQSIYSFRYAAPDGIQDFPAKYPAASSHSLRHCFRCTPSILDAAYSLIAAYPAPKRIPKTVSSLYSTASPIEPGAVYRWRFKSDVAEAKAIAASCSDLILKGISPGEIMILLSAVPPIGRTITDQLDRLNLPYEAPREEPFSTTVLGRAVLGLSRIVCDPKDYLAHRTILGLLPKVGMKTANDIAHAVLSANINYRDVFYAPLPAGVFDSRGIKALTRARAIIAGLAGWSGTDAVVTLAAELDSLLVQLVGGEELVKWASIKGTLPPGMTIEDLRAYCWADTQARQDAVLEIARERIPGANPEPAVTAARIRIMTMHGAKGLSATVVFIPGLEDSFLPGPKRAPYPGLVLEAARLLFVSMSRARAACILSFAHARRIHGAHTVQIQCPFCAALAGPFVWKHGGMDAKEVSRTVASVGNL